MTNALEIKLTVPDLSNLIAMFDNAASILQTAVAPALYTKANKIMTEAKKLTPVDTGALRSSGHVEPPVISGQSVEVALGFNTPYALYVHENLAAHHPVGQAKYLETPMVEAAKSLGPEIGIAIQASMNKIGGGR